MKGRFSCNWYLRILALPFTGGFILSVTLVLPFLISTGHWGREWKGLFGMFFLGAFLSAIVGWPLLAIIQCLFSKFRFRYVVGGIVCSIGIWILLDGPIFPKDWYRWAEADFWLAYAPRRVAIFACFGLITGAVYTAAVALINRWVPERRKST
jgi:hypothetical protein